MAKGRTGRKEGRKEGRPRGEGKKGHIGEEICHQPKRIWTLSLLVLDDGASGAEIRWFVAGCLARLARGGRPFAELRRSVCRCVFQLTRSQAAAG